VVEQRVIEVEEETVERQGFAAFELRERLHQSTSICAITDER
jgi:hypothetical protein